MHAYTRTVEPQECDFAVIRNRKGAKKMCGVRGISPKGKGAKDGFHKPHGTTEPNAVQPPSLSASASPTQGLIPEGDVLVVTSQDKVAPNLHDAAWSKHGLPGRHFRSMLMGSTATHTNISANARSMRCSLQHQFRHIHAASVVLVLVWQEASMEPWICWSAPCSAESCLDHESQ